MADVFFDNPPVLVGPAEQQLRQLQMYLNTMSEKLNQAQQQLTTTQSAESSVQNIRMAGGGQAISNDEREKLKSLIIKNAEIVLNEMQEISTYLEGQYTAISEQMGTYTQNLDATITATAEGILQEYGFEERIQSLQTDTEAFYRKINQYIFTGLVDEVNGRYGIAIGEGVTSYDNEGNPVLNSNAKTATFTMDRLSFWHGTTEIAYFADNIFHIAQGEVTHSMAMGNYLWKIMPDGSLALMNA